MIEDVCEEIYEEICIINEPFNPHIVLARYIHDNKKYSTKQRLINSLSVVTNNYSLSSSQSQQRITYHLSVIIISLLCQSNHNNLSLKDLYQLKIEEDFNEYQLKKKIKEIKVSDIYLHAAIHLVKYFCSADIDQIIEFVSGLYDKIQYQYKEMGQVYEIVDRISTILYPTNLKYNFQCYCFNKSIFKPTLNTILRCEQCLTAYHQTCQSQLLLCNKCYQMQSSLNTKVIEQLNISYIFPQGNINVICFEVDQLSGSMLQLRINNIIKQNNNQNELLQFFNIYTIYVNHQPLKFKRQLLNNSKIIKIPNYVLSKRNILIIKKGKLKKLQQKNIYLIGVYKCQRNKKLAPQEITKQQSLNLLKKVAPNKKVRIPTIDMISKQRIKIPVRGHHCQHYQCFDFDMFHKRIFFNFSSKKKSFKLAITSIKKEKEEKLIYRKQIQQLKRKRQKDRKCPICLKNLSSLYIDPIVKKILNKISDKKQLNYITILETGQLEQIISIEDNCIVLF